MRSSPRSNESCGLQLRESCRHLGQDGFGRFPSVWLDLLGGRDWLCNGYADTPLTGKRLADINVISREFCAQVLQLKKATAFVPTGSDFAHHATAGAEPLGFNPHLLQGSNI